MYIYFSGYYENITKLLEKVIDMMDEKDKKFLGYLRQNSRTNLTTISKKTGIPISTLYDRLKSGEKNIIIKHTTLLDFAKLGFGCRANLILKVKREARDDIREYLSKHESVNALWKINNGFDYLADVIFNNIKDLEDFLENLDTKFKLTDKKVHYIIEEIVRENFLSNVAVA